MGKASQLHKIREGYLPTTTYQGSGMRGVTPVTTFTGLTIVHTAPINTVVSTMATVQGRSGETFAYIITDPAGKFKIVTNTIQNIAANVPVGSYPVTINTIGSLGSTRVDNITLTST